MDTLKRLASTFGRAPLALRLVVVILGIQVLAYAGIVAGELVPDAAVADNLVQATVSGDLTAADYGKAPGGHRVDHYTECIVLTEGLGDPQGSTPFETAATSPNLGRCSLAVPRLIGYSSTGSFEDPGSYFRYWHGYTVLTRPALALFGLGSTRALCLYLVVASLGGTWWMARSRFGAWVASALTLPAVLTADVLEIHASLPQAIAWASAFFCAMLTMALLSPRGRVRRVTPSHLVMVGILCGSLVAYFDLMIAMAANLCLLLTLTLLITQQQEGRELPWPRAAGSLVAVGAGWLAGLATTWISKWLVAAAFLGIDPVVENVKKQVGFRINGGSDYAPGGLGSAVKSNLTAWTDSRLVQALLLSTFVALGLVVARSWRRGSLRPATLLMFGGVSLCVPVWFELLSSHSQIHYWLTFRSFAVALSAIIVGVIQATRADADTDAGAGAHGALTPEESLPTRASDDDHKPAGANANAGF